MAPNLTQEQVRMAHSLKAKGFSQADIARELGCTEPTISVIVRGKQQGVGRPVKWVPREGRLSLEEREEILVGLRKDESLVHIARTLGRSPSTISREVKNNEGREGYGAWRAHCRARTKAERHNAAKFDHPPLLDQVSEWLRLLWSPKQISGRLRCEYPDDPMMQVSYETIYKSLYVQGKGELRRELARCLRTGRTARRHHHSGPQVQGKLANMVNISERPAEVADRAVPGHWEGDLIIGANQKSAVGTLVERTTRFVMLLHLPDGRDAEHVETALKKAVLQLPDELVRSITWDQGKEMGNHVDFTIDTDIEVYFCDPHSPWQRGSNENTNGLLRQYMPKGTDLSQHSEEDLERIQRSLNGRPRETLGFMTPSEKFTELIALAL